MCSRSNLALQPGSIQTRLQSQSKHLEPQLVCKYQSSPKRTKGPLTVVCWKSSSLLPSTQLSSQWFFSWLKSTLGAIINPVLTFTRSDLGTAICSSLKWHEDIFNLIKTPQQRISFQCPVIVFNSTIAHHTSQAHMALRWIASLPHQQFCSLYYSMFIYYKHAVFWSNKSCLLLQTMLIGVVRES